MSCFLCRGDFMRLALLLRSYSSISDSVEYLGDLSPNRFGSTSPSNSYRTNMFHTMKPQQGSESRRASGRTNLVQAQSAP